MRLDVESREWEIFGSMTVIKVLLTNVFTIQTRFQMNSFPAISSKQWHINHTDRPHRYSIFPSSYFHIQMLNVEPEEND